MDKQCPQCLSIFFYVDLNFHCLKQLLFYSPEIMLLLNLAWNDWFVKVSKCDTSKIIFN